MPRLQPRPRPYHHGDLAAALVAAAERLIAERGLDSFTLRECARRAGVSHAAPAHHFNDVNGLLTAVARAGYDRLTEWMDEAAGAAGDAGEALSAIGLAYIRFALAFPALFRLMFHSDRIDRDDPDFRAASQRAFAVLQSKLAAVRGQEGAKREAIADDPLLLSAWAKVHGIATLAIEGRLGPRRRQNDERILAAARSALAVRPDGSGR